MPEGSPSPKVPQMASPLARTGGGDLSERELSMERSNLHSTPPPTRMHVHPKKQLFSVPVNKFTAKVAPSSCSSAVRLRSCLAELQRRDATPARAPLPRPKAVSMEDLTPTKRLRREKSDLPTVQSPGLQSCAEQQAAQRIGRFLLLAVWRRRRDEVRCLRKTLESQVSCSEKLRIQVSTLKSLLDSDNAKVRLAMRELDRLKHLLRDKDMEKTVLEREKLALENDICAAEDRASEISIEWRNTRNELECARAAAALSEHALRCEQAAAHEARQQRDHAYTRLSTLESEMAEHEELLSNAEAEVAALRREAEDRQRALETAHQQLKAEQLARERCNRECATLTGRVTAATEETERVRGAVRALQGEVCRLDAALKIAHDQLQWWPAPLTKMMGMARSLLRSHRCTTYVPEAVLWSLIPARHGC